MFPKATSLPSKISITALLFRSHRSRVGESVLRAVLDEKEIIVRTQGVAEEEPGGRPRFGGMKAVVKGLVKSGEVKAALRRDLDVRGVVRS
ncbi:hypothetical protein HOY82DRAFT_612506 [Tuber indicum]|nr:hypothetical protein HOY82DRAFT_612506 [Tuber indicum]